MTDFILLGFSYSQEIKYVLFALVLVIYLVTLIANGLILTVVVANANLHSPMYFFLWNLSCVDLFYSTTSIPKGLEGFLKERNLITFYGCAAQMYFALSLGIVQCILLAVMAWDRYIAICYPLNYTLIMNTGTCCKLAAITWCNGFLLSVVHVSVTLPLPRCGKNVVDYATCEVTAVLRLACGDIRLSEIVIFVMSVGILLVPLSLVLFSYTYIVATILKMPTAEGRRRAFSTCSSHLVVVTLFYGSAMVMYLRPRSMVSPEKDKVISVFYAVLTPALNPLIYTLRNKEVKGALKTLLPRAVVFSWPDL
ncbi:olfactory receptor 2F1-like [Ambystoma mexicanum]|uniref:olfactory receptor 2F1-like n=1 Tax=Ambystoma mexicanum TaxID=8296 RepID=UPI0037E843DE